MFHKESLIQFMAGSGCYSVVQMILLTVMGGVALAASRSPNLALNYDAQLTCLTVGKYEALSDQDKQICQHFFRSDEFAGAMLVWQSYYVKSTLSSQVQAIGAIALAFVVFPVVFIVASFLERALRTHDEAAAHVLAEPQYNFMRLFHMLPAGSVKKITHIGLIYKSRASSA
eukprot:jgi/Phyca11/537321/estExt2_fgenesh1_pg.C_PHYCAscaffold_840014